MSLRIVTIALASLLLSGCLGGKPGGSGSETEAPNVDTSCLNSALFLGVDGWSRQPPESLVEHPVMASAVAVGVAGFDGTLRLPMEGEMPDMDIFNISATLYLAAANGAIGFGAPTMISIEGLYMQSPNVIAPGQRVAASHEWIVARNSERFDGAIEIDAWSYLHLGQNFGGLVVASDPAYPDIHGAPFGAVSRIEVEACEP